MQTLSQKLRRKNIKATNQRIAVYDYLSNTVSHPNAESIYRALSLAYPQMSLATVYKTLSKLSQAQLIQEINIGEGCFRYDANYSPHPHFICLECRNVIDLPMPESLMALRNDMKALSSCDIRFEQIYYYGSCEVCRAEH